jgi:hypothetical protein
MHIHKPKALHGWREFLGEIGVIVCGVLIAIALEQIVETLHRHAQAREMIRKLRDEGRENLHVIDYDLGVCQRQLAAIDKDIAAVSTALKAARLPAAPEALPSLSVFLPADAAWVTVRDSALLPIMPKATVDNYWKIDTINEGLRLRGLDAGVSSRRLSAATNVAAQRPMDLALANDILLALNQTREDARSYCSLARGYRKAIDQALADQVIDTVGDLTRARPAAATPP